LKHRFLHWFLPEWKAEQLLDRNHPHGRRLRKSYKKTKHGEKHLDCIWRRDGVLPDASIYRVTWLGDYIPGIFGVR